MLVPFVFVSRGEVAARTHVDVLGVTHRMNPSPAIGTEKFKSQRIDKQPPQPPLGARAAGYRQSRGTWQGAREERRLGRRGRVRGPSTARPGVAPAQAVGEGCGCNSRTTPRHCPRDAEPPASRPRRRATSNRIPTAKPAASNYHTPAGVAIRLTRMRPGDRRREARGCC